MGLRDGRAQRVPAGVLALDAGQVLRPRLVRRGPQRVGGGPDLEEHRVEPAVDRDVEVGEQFGRAARPRSGRAGRASHGWRRSPATCPASRLRPPRRRPALGVAADRRRVAGDHAVTTARPARTSAVTAAPSHTSPHTPRIRPVTDRLRPPACPHPGDRSSILAGNVHDRSRRRTTDAARALAHREGTSRRQRRGRCDRHRTRRSGGLRPDGRGHRRGVRPRRPRRQGRRDHRRGPGDRPYPAVQLPAPRPPSAARSPRRSATRR